MYDDFPYDVDVEALVVLSFDVTVNVHVKHFGDNALFKVRNTIWPLN